MKSSDAQKATPSPDPCVLVLREMLQSVLGDNFLRLYHYGSRVEGTADVDSDYDVLCVTKQVVRDNQKKEILDRQLDIQMNSGVLFDLHFRTVDQVDSASFVYSPFVDYVVSEGILI